MKYGDEVPRDKQITLDRFPLLPGSLVRREFSAQHWRQGTVREVWSANPEYILWKQRSGKKTERPDNAGVVVWKRFRRGDRRACEQFLRGGRHAPIRLRLERSMWVVIEYEPERSFEHSHPKPYTEILYTYDILDAIKRGNLVIVKKR